MGWVKNEEVNKLFDKEGEGTAVDLLDSDILSA